MCGALPASEKHDLIARRPASRWRGLLRFLEVLRVQLRAPARPSQQQEFLGVRIFALLACIGYWILLTLLLLVPDPAALLGLQRVPSLPWGKFGVHLSFFLAVSVLVCAVWWSRRCFWPMVAPSGSSRHCNGIAATAGPASYCPSEGRHREPLGDRRRSMHRPAL